MQSKIKKLFDADQKDRLANKNIDWKKVIPRDEKRLIIAKNIVKEGVENLTGQELYWLSFLFQHGPDNEDILQANNLAKKSLSLGYEDALWMICASWDRYLHRTTGKQVYGTQYQIIGEKNIYMEIDQTISDDDLVKQGLPTRKQYKSYKEKIS